MRLNAFLVLVALWGCSQVAGAQEQAARPVSIFDSAMLYSAHGVDHNLRELPGAILGQGVQWEPTYFTALALDKTLGTLGGSLTVFRETPLENVKFGYEVVLAQHHGLQRNAELGAAMMVRTPDWGLGPLALNFGTGVGLSYAFGTPSYEDTPVGEPDRYYRTQLLVLFDVEWKLREWTHFSIVTRVHHRSGAYGVIAPTGVGSNFLAVGIRYDF